MKKFLLFILFFIISESVYSQNLDLKCKINLTSTVTGIGAGITISGATMLSFDQNQTPLKKQCSQSLYIIGTTLGVTSILSVIIGEIKIMPKRDKRFIAIFDKSIVSFNF